MPVNVISSRRVYSGAVSLRKDRFSINGRVVEKEIVEHRPSVGILAVAGDSLILITQYRRAPDKTLLEIPAGKIEEGEHASGRNHAVKKKVAEFNEMNAQVGRNRYENDVSVVNAWIRGLHGYDFLS